MSLTEAQNAMLKAPLDPKNVRKPEGKFGPKGDYLEGWFVMNELNRVFGFDGWSYTIDLSRDALSEGQDSKGNPQWQAAYTCVCTLTAAGVTRQDVGFGSGFAKQVGDAIEGATKEAATDALKRAARTFGNIFGLALYDKERANVHAPPPPTITDDQRIELMNLFEATAFPVDRFLSVSKIKDLRELPAAKFEGAKGWIKQEAKKLTEQAA
ncbi:RAD52 family DNA repair protein [Croceicoccus sp. YJ47]|uniref:RAD52 family DNA repair protein n=1 Tax=Croceicoccus sp. YJ47 TaxID=2798724 RepID=UPI0019244BC8|nr:RAD52 family DNA repair protein [Croceicoccus sp. YJ47]QQN73914.1 RAD52 family DNA repair protein [Croceicoccus sp. YJ47]